MPTKRILTRVKIDIIATETFIYISYNPKTELYAQINLLEPGYIIDVTSKGKYSEVFPSKEHAILKILYELRDEKTYNHTDTCKIDLDQKIDFYRKEIFKNKLK